ncbi:MAG: hypothetical protein KGD72_08695, partial [Candidatus Lokiarchaeota archaeon]|nr:hypothetical protein [Candidatus Lokiarchaeota archaeon]
GYTEPIPVTFFIEVNPVPTQLSVFNYVSQTNYTSNEESEYWNEAINFTVFYYREGDFDAKLKDATLSYEWAFGSGPILQDPLKPEGYYYFELNTSDSPNVGRYQIKISAQLQNYTTITDFDFFIEILTRQTYINGKNTLEYISKNLYIEDAYNFTFDYTDVLKNNELIGDLDVAAFTWNKLDDDGIPLNGTEYSGIGTLLQNPDNSYTLDFDTETREVGEYSIFITLHKSNYEVGNSLVSLRIIKRAITISFSATGLSGSQINVVQGTSVEFTLTLYDPTNGNQLLTDADVTLKIGTNEDNLTEVQEGVYAFTFPTENIEAFIMPVTLQGLITIEKENYNIETIQLSIIVGMPEIFPGFPMFYFLMIVGAVIAVVGSLVAYRQIQRARIPTFVKKVREMSKNIKGRKSISESLLYPSKNEFIVKKLGDRWEVLGLSLNEILGLDAKRKKKLPETTDFEGGNV